MLTDGRAVDAMAVVVGLTKIPYNDEPTNVFIRFGWNFLGITSCRFACGDFQNDALRRKCWSIGQWGLLIPKNDVHPERSRDAILRRAPLAQDELSRRSRRVVS